MDALFEDRYHCVETRHWWFAGRRDLLLRLLHAAQAGPDCRILDVGCSGGATLSELRAEGYRAVTGIDISSGAIAQCRRQGFTDVYVMDGQAPAFPDCSFDVILASDVLEHVSDERAAAGAWFRLLRPGGLLIALVPAFMMLWSAHDEANHHHRRYRLRELRAGLEAVGFCTERTSYWNCLLFPLAAVWRLLQGSRQRPGTAHTELRVPPAPANALLRAVLVAENSWVGAGHSWPWGLSAMVTARRPSTPA